MVTNAAAYVRLYVHSAMHGAPQYRAAECAGWRGIG